MFRELRDTIKSLNSDVKTIANCEKAKKLRKKLLSIGLPLAVIGLGGAFACFVLFATAGEKAFTDTGFSARVLVPFFLLIPCAIVGGIGATLSSYGFKIIVTGYAANLIDEAVGNNCPYCGGRVYESTLFCANCGKPLKKQCSACGHANDVQNKYCEKCGQKLD